MKSTSRIGSSPIANAARHGSAAATTAATMIPIGHHRRRHEADHARPQPRGRELERQRHRDHRHAGDAGADEQPQQRRCTTSLRPAPARARRWRARTCRMPAISGRRRPRRSPSAAPDDAAADRAHARGQQHHRRLAERQVPLVGQVGDDEGDQEEVEQVEHRADHHRAGEHVEAARERRLVERLAGRGARAASGSPSARRRRVARSSCQRERRRPGQRQPRAPTSSTQKPAAGSASPISMSVVRPEEVTSGRSTISTITSAITARATAAQRGQALPRASARARAAPPSPRRSPRAPTSAGRRRCWIGPGGVRVAALGRDDPIEVERLRVQQEQAAAPRRPRPRCRGGGGAASPGTAPPRAASTRSAQDAPAGVPVRLSDAASAPRFYGIRPLLSLPNVPVRTPRALEAPQGAVSGGIARESSKWISDPR